MYDCKPSFDKPMRFTRAEYYTFRPLTLNIPFYDSTCGPFNTLPIPNWLVLYDEDGVTGECPCDELMGRLLLPMLLNGETHSYKEWYHETYWKIRNNGFSGESAVELGRLDLALFDIMAKRENMPLHRFLGATRDWVNVYSSGCGTNLTREQTVNELETFLKKGYTVYKMKAATSCGATLDADIERIAMIREIIGPDNKLAVDVNQLWDAKDALAFAQRIEKYNIAWYEEPVHSHNICELEKLTKDCPMKVSMGESMRNHYQYYAYVKAGVNHLQPVPSNMCGVRDWLKVRDLAHENKLDFSSGGFGHISASYIASGREEDMVEYLHPIQYKFREILERCPEERDGKFFLSGDAGIPVAVDFKLLDRMGLIAKKETLLPND